MNICVYGASSNKISETYTKAAYALGEEIAKRGHTLVFGAGNYGCMGAAAYGAKKHNAEIIGVAPTFFDIDGMLFPDCTEFIAPQTMRERKQILEERSDAFVVTPGGIGTFDEFFEIITLKQLERHTKAIAVLNVDGYYDDLEELLNKAVREEFMTAASKELAKFFTDSKELIDYLEDYVPHKVVISEMKNI